MSSQRRVYGYDPANGKELWTVDGTIVRGHPDAGRRPRSGVLLVRTRRPDAGDSPWRIGRRHADARRLVDPEGLALRSRRGIIVGDVLYLVNDMQSIVTASKRRPASCSFRAGSARRSAKGFSASPVAVDGKVFFTNDDGETFVLEAGREFKLLHVNRLGEATLRRRRWSTAPGTSGRRASCWPSAAAEPLW